MKNKIKIAFILPSLAGGGAEKVILNIITNIDKKKFEPELVVFDKSGPLISYLPKNIKIINFKKKRLRNCIFLLIKYFYSNNPKIVFSTFGYINLFLIFIRILLPKQIKIVIREANTLTSTIKLYKHPLLMKFFFSRLYKRADKVIALSKAMAEELKKEFNVFSKKISIVYNPVDLKFIRNKIQKIKKQKNNKINFISSGRLVKQKGFDRLISISSKFPKNSHLTIIGDGPELNNLKNVVKKKNLESKITFIGFQKNPWQWYASADAMLITSYWEGMPNSAIESLACGCQIISVNGLPGIRDIKKLSKNNGSVSIESFPDNFLKKVKKVTKKRRKKTPNKSMLPKEFKIENSLKKFERMFFSVLNVSDN